MLNQMLGDMGVNINLHTHYYPPIMIINNSIIPFTAYATGPSNDQHLNASPVIHNRA